MYGSNAQASRFLSQRPGESDYLFPELAVTFHEMTEFRIEDPDGNRLWIGQARGESGDA